MPIVQQITSKSYALIEPRLDWARGKISLLDGACGKFETLAMPVITTTDKCIDTTLDVVATRVTAVQASVAKRVAPVKAKLGEVQDAIVVRGLDLVDSSESAIDRLLPVPTRAVLKQSSDQEDTGKRGALVYRVARLPFAVPLRITMVMYLKANGAVEAVLLSGRQVVGLAWEKQNQFAQQIMQRAKPLTDKIATVTNSSIERVRAGKVSAAKGFSDGRQMVVVKVNNIMIRLHLVEIKTWSEQKSTDLKATAANMLMLVVHGAHGTSMRVIGEQRTTQLFTKLPVEVPIKVDKSQVIVSSVAPAKTKSHKRSGSRLHAGSEPVKND